MKNLEKYYRKFPFELTCLIRFVFLHKNLKNLIRYNLKKGKFGFLLDGAVFSFTGDECNVTSFKHFIW